MVETHTAGMYIPGTYLQGTIHCRTCTNDMMQFLYSRCCFCFCGMDGRISCTARFDYSLTYSLREQYGLFRVCTYIQYIIHGAVVYPHTATHTSTRTNFHNTYTIIHNTYWYTVIHNTYTIIHNKYTIIHNTYTVPGNP